MRVIPCCSLEDQQEDLTSQTGSGQVRQQVACSLRTPGVGLPGCLTTCAQYLREEEEQEERWQATGRLSLAEHLGRCFQRAGSSGLQPSLSLP